MSSLLSLLVAGVSARPRLHVRTPFLAVRPCHPTSEPKVVPSALRCSALPYPLPGNAPECLQRHVRRSCSKTQKSAPLTSVTLDYVQRKTLCMDMHGSTLVYIYIYTCQRLGAVSSPLGRPARTGKSFRVVQPRARSGCLVGSLIKFWVCGRSLFPFVSPALPFSFLS